jgi:hypothetical protein
VTAAPLTRHTQGRPLGPPSPWLYDNGVNRTDLPINASIKFDCRAACSLYERGQSLMICGRDQISLQGRMQSV